MKKFMPFVLLAMISGCANDPSVYVDQEQIDAIPYCRDRSGDLIFSLVTGPLVGGVSANMLDSNTLGAMVGAGHVVGTNHDAILAPPCPPNEE